MIKIDFQEPTDPQWVKWREKCEDAQKELNAAVERGAVPRISEDLYKARKDIYCDHHGPFHGKCAYCETLMAADQPGDIDHFRPKKRVSDGHGKPVMRMTEHGGQAHGGYYWLVYDWRNLLPSCCDCNRPSKRKSGGTLIGKRDHFPVKDFRAWRPGDEIKEEPLLIHPVYEDPEKHLKIDAMGTFQARTPRGQACIDILGLNHRTALVEARKETYEKVIDKAAILALNLIQKAQSATVMESKLQSYKEGKQPYSCAGRLALKHAPKLLAPLMDLSHT